MEEPKKNSRVNDSLPHDIVVAVAGSVAGALTTKLINRPVKTKRKKER
jgi:hypothetical protein